MDESTERQIIGDCLAKKGGPLSGYVARRWLPLKVATSDVRIALAPGEAVPGAARVLARFGNIVESRQGSFSALVWDGELENPVVVTLTVRPPAFAATELLLVSLRAAAGEGLIKRRSAAVLLPRVVAALEHLATER